MTAVARRALGLTATLLLGWALVAVTGPAVGWFDAEAASLRLSWSAKPERIETCRALSESELAARPVHMRQTEACVGTSASYALLVIAGTDTLASDVIRGGGLRGDRPLFVLREYPMPPGATRVRVRFERREDRASSTSPGSLPPLLEFDSTVTFRRGFASLLTVEDGRFRVVPH